MLGSAAVHPSQELPPSSNDLDRNNEMMCFFFFYPFNPRVTNNPSRVPGTGEAHPAAWNTDRTYAARVSHPDDVSLRGAGRVGVLRAVRICPPVVAAASISRIGNPVAVETSPLHDKSKGGIMVPRSLIRWQWFSIAH